MTRALIHRGPDDVGEYITPDIGLGMRRLSIIDRAHGQQPMRTDDGRLVLVFNGETYNYRRLRRALESEACAFHAESETEVVLRLLQRHGTDVITQLEGMCAFELWVTQTR